MDNVWLSHTVGKPLSQDVHGNDQDRVSSSRRENFTFSTTAMALYDFHKDDRHSNLDDMSLATLVDSSNPEGSFPMKQGSESSVGNL